MDFLKKHGLRENSHTMDWFNALLPMTPKDNLEDPFKVKVSCAELGHVLDNEMNNKKCMRKGAHFTGKYRPFKKEDIMQIIGMYIIDGLVRPPGWYERCSHS